MLVSGLDNNEQTLKALPTRDALLPVLALLSNPNGVSAQVVESPSIYTASGRIQDSTREDSLALIEKINTEPSFLQNKIGLIEAIVTAENEVDGYRMTLSTGDIIHLRPSGNAPKLRCYCESSTKDKALLFLKKH